ncbi:caspase family protein [Rhodopseudomonas sp. B29]|uniref:caspase family protein n=1 Tax=Rhodopseudomonas sp. B29 TaxID=95607 RepID=UPI00034917AC|nr:caspase family protein [Rhodopseudomonas sp. B29]
MLRAFWGQVAVATALLFGTADAMAESRLALVIGQSAYKAVPALPNPVNDAKAIEQMLGEAGFEVTAASDLGQTQLREVVGDFAAKLAGKGPDTVALMFYAGHGIQVDGENYLIPVDVDPKREADIPLQAVRLNDVLNTLASAPGKTRIIMLDACRNNPFPQLSGTAGHGLALVDTRTGAPGTLLSYSTSPGAEAEDGNGANSPYTSALLKAGRESGLQIEDTLKRVRLAVNKATSGRQTPWESSSLVDDFRFFGSAEAAAQPDTKPGKKPSADEWRALLKGKSAEEAHALIVADGSGEAYEAFVSLYAEPPYATETKLWLDRHRRMQAWSRAILINTASAYRGFLSQYPDSDLTATAKKLEERTRNRPEPVAVAAVAPASPAPTNAALTCPCAVPPSPPAIDKPKKADTKKSKRAEEDAPSRRTAKKPVRGRYYDDEDDVVVVPRRPVIIDTPAPVIGYGGGYGGGYRGGYRGPSGPSYQGGGYQGGGRMGGGR